MRNRVRVPNNTAAGVYRNDHVRCALTPYHVHVIGPPASQIAGAVRICCKSHSGSSTLMALRGCPSTVVSSVTQRCTSKALLGTPVLGRVSSSTSVARVPAAGRRQQGWNSSRRVHMQAMEGSNKNYPKGIEDIGVNLLTGECPCCCIRLLLYFKYT